MGAIPRPLMSLPWDMTTVYKSTWAFVLGHQNLQEENNNYL